MLGKLSRDQVDLSWASVDYGLSTAEQGNINGIRVG